MKKVDTSGMKDMFEQAKQDVIASINAQIAAKQQEINSLKGTPNEYDSGLGDIEDRLYIMNLENEIRALEQERAKKIEELSVHQK
jgi:hypothetical protein